MTGKTNLLVAHLRNLDITADRNYFSYLMASHELTINNLSKQPSTFGVENRTLGLLHDDIWKFLKAHVPEAG